MKAMILAAGLGERMRPLTEHTPKPLLSAGGKPLLQWHLEHLAAAGFSELVINVSHLGQQIIDFVGDGRPWQCVVEFSRETEPLETAGGIIQALPLLGDAPFAIVNGDIWCDYDLARLQSLDWCEGQLAHLVLVDNPLQHTHGDFSLDVAGDGILSLAEGGKTYTYSGIAVYHPDFFAGVAPGKLPLRPLLDKAIAAGRVTGEHHSGAWTDVGTPERLAELDAQLGSL